MTTVIYIKQEQRIKHQIFPRCTGRVYLRGVLQALSRTLKAGQTAELHIDGVTTSVVTPCYHHKQKGDR